MTETVQEINETDSLPPVNTAIAQELNLTDSQAQFLNQVVNPLIKGVINAGINKIDSFMQADNNSPARANNRTNISIALKRLCQLESSDLSAIETPSQLIRLINEKDPSRPLINEDDEMLIVSIHETASRSTGARITTITEILTTDQYRAEINDSDLSMERLAELSTMVPGSNFMDNPTNQLLQVAVERQLPGKKVLSGQTVLPGLYYLSTTTNTVQITY